MNISEQSPKYIAGIIGGMGPSATVDFLAKVVAATDAESDQQHIRMIIDHNPQVPDRHAAIAGEAPDLGPLLAATARRLEAAGADFLVMTCNTAHAWEREIRAAVDIPFISIIDVVVEEVGRRDARHVGVMAARGCLQAELYQRALSAAGYEPLIWDADELQRFMAVVYRIKAGDRDPDIHSELRKLAASLEFQGADVLVAGCTEIPLFLGKEDTTVPLLCSTDLLVQRTIAMANRLSTPEDLKCT
jgi:aspartate racemase